MEKEVNKKNLKRTEYVTLKGLCCFSKIKYRKTAKTEQYYYRALGQRYIKL